MKKHLARLLIVGVVTALVVGAYYAGKNSGIRYGALNHAVKQCDWAMRAGNAMATNDYNRADRLIYFMLIEAEAEMLRFDNRKIEGHDFLSRDHARYEWAGTLVALDAYWAKHPRVIALGARLDETNVEKYGLGGGAAINAGRDGYQLAYSNSIARARAHLGK